MLKMREGMSERGYYHSGEEHAKEERSIFMRKLTVFVMLFTLPLCIIVGIAESLPFHAGSPPEFHIFVAVIFTLACLVHIWLNRKPMLRHIRGVK